MDRDRTQREPQSLEAWETWVDHLIVEAQERGEFDDLPGHGKPLQIEDAPFAGGMEVGYGILKNARVAPYWVELGKEIQSITARLELLETRACEMATTITTREIFAPVAPANAGNVANHRWWWWLRRRNKPENEIRSEADRAAVEVARLRREYVEQAALLDRAIGQYNASIPRDLWHLERPRTSPDEAARAFDRLIAGGDGNSNART